MVSSTNSAARSTASGSMSIAERTACSASSEYGGRRSEYGSRAGGAIENSTGELDIFPGGTFPRRIPEKRRGMISDDERNAVVAVDFAAKLSDGRFRVEKSLRCEGPERNDYFRFYQLELPYQIRAAGLDLVRRRIAVPRRAVLDDIGDEDLLPRQVHGTEDLRQEPSSRADEGQSRFVLGCSGRFSDAHQPRLRVAFPGHTVVGGLVERAPRARFDGRSDRLQ